MRPRSTRSTLASAGIALVGLAAALTFLFAPPRLAPTGDEGDYLRAAIHLARSGVHSSAPSSEAVPAPDAYREPGYPALLAAAWRFGGVDPPRSEAGLLGDSASSAARTVRLLGGLLLALTALAAALAVRAAVGGPAAGVATAALVLASPALRQAALTPGSEALAAALVTLVALGWVRAVRSPTVGAVLLAGAAAGLAPLARGATVVLIPVGIVLMLAAPRALPIGRRVRLAALFALLALAPSAAWALRNLEATGNLVLADRSGQVRNTRAELDRQVAREGLLPALAAWTPIEGVRRAGARRWPEATYLRFEWQGEGNYFTRSLRRWHAARRPPADPIEADRRLGREAMREFLASPARHLVASAAVAWRGLFAERSPEGLQPVDLTFALALLFAGAFARAGWRALRDRSWTLAALLAGPAALFLFHALLTEFHPRYSLPALPLAWGAVALALFGATPAAGRTERAGATAPKGKR